MTRYCVAGVAVFSLFLGTANVAQGAIIQAGPSDDVEGMINALVPGDELVLAEGVYTLTDRFSFVLSGTQAQPIIIRAADGATPHFNRPTAAQNIWDFTATWVVIRGIRFSGGSAGLRIEGADHLTIEDCEIDSTADVALRMNDSGITYSNVQILRNHIHDTNGTGEGMYLGCNSDACRLLDCLIEGNYVHHTNQSSVSQGDGIELKEGSAGNIIRDNVIHDTNYPCILTYSAAGNGAANIIEGNLLWNCGDHGIQSAQDSTIRNNIILGATYDAISLQPHQAGAPGNQIVVHNTVFNDGGNGIVVREATGSVVVANNAVYAQGGFAIRVVGGDSNITFGGNVGVGGQDGTTNGGYTEGSLAADFVDAHFSGAPPLDCFPAAGGALVGAAVLDHLTTVDFNGSAREGALDSGAYLFDANGNPGWTLIPGFKEGNPIPPVECGDGVVDATEACDDGNLGDGDGCDAVCAIEAGYACTGEPSVCTDVSATCGDGVVDPGEVCDDANLADGDGCDGVCTVEDNFNCTGEPSVCTPVSVTCGDGVVDSGEACDDGNTADGDGCSATCMNEPDPSDGDSGCGCTTSDLGAPWSGLVLLFALALGLAVRRKSSPRVAFRCRPR
jgi:MYXO-CTERM domain-containing protein